MRRCDPDSYALYKKTLAHHVVCYLFLNTVQVDYYKNFGYTGLKTNTPIVIWIVFIACAFVLYWLYDAT